MLYYTVVPPNLAVIQQTKDLPQTTNVKWKGFYNEEISQNGEESELNMLQQTEKLGRSEQ